MTDLPFRLPTPVEIEGLGETEGSGFTFDTASTPTVPSIDDDTASDRAKKYNYALGDRSPGEDVLFDEIRNGGEQSRRTLVHNENVGTQNEKRQQEALSLIQSGTKDAQKVQELLKPIPGVVIVGDDDLTLEKEFASKIIQAGLSTLDPQTLNEIRGKVGLPTDRLQNHIAAREGFQKIQDEQTKAWKDSSFVSAAGSFALTLIPGYSWWATQDTVKDPTITSLLPGSNMRDQITYLYQLALGDPQKAVQQAREAVRDIASRSPLDAVTFSQRLLAYSSFNEAFSNVTGVADALTIGSTVPSALRASLAATRAIVGVSKATAGKAFSLTGLVDATGDVERATKLELIDRLRGLAKTVAAPQSFKDIEKDAVSLFNSDAVLGNSRFLSREQLTRVQNALNRSAGELLQSVTDATRIARLGEGRALETAIDEAIRAAKLEYPWLNDTVLDIKPIASQDTLSGVAGISIDIGKPKVSAKAVSKPSPNGRVPTVASQDALTKFGESKKLFESLSRGLSSEDKADYRKWKSLKEEEMNETQLIQQHAFENPNADFTALSKNLDQSFIFDRSTPPEVRRNMIRIQKGLAGLEAKHDVELFQQLRMSEFHRDFPSSRKAIRLPSLANDNSKEQVAIDIGKRGATPFDTEEAARKTAEDFYKIRGYSVEQQGGKYFLRITKTVDETDWRVRDALAVETKGQTPRSLANMFLGYVRSREYQTSQRFTEDIKSATYGTSGMQHTLTRVFNEGLGDIKWRKEDWKKFDKFIIGQRDFEKDGVRGKFSKTAGDFELEWFGRFNERPSEAMTKAYFTYTQLSDFDSVLRNIQMLTARQRRGEEMFDFPLNGVTTKKNFIRGKFLPDGLPKIEDDAGVAVWNADPKQIKFFRTRFVQGRHDIDNPDKVSREMVDNLLKKEGYKVVQLTRDGERIMREFGPLKDVFGDRAPINYVIVKDYKVSPLEVKQIPYKPGGHVEYLDGYFIKQPVISRSTGRFDKTYYHGDNTVMHFLSERDGQKYHQLMEGARKLYDDEKALETYLQRNLPHVFPNVGEFKRQWHATKLDKDVPLFLVPKNKTIDQTHDLNRALGRSERDSIIITRDSPHNLERDAIDFQYTGERDSALPTIINEKPREASTLDPTSTLIRAAGQLMRGRYLGDLKTKASESFISEFGHLLDAKSLDEIRSHPLNWLLSPKWKSGAPLKELAAARAMRRSVLSLIGEETEVQKYANYIRFSVAEKIFEASGGSEKGYKIATNVLDIANTKDPIKYARSVAFMGYMGLWTIPQFFIQLSTIAHMAGVAGPLRATQAMGAGFLMRALALTNKANIIDHIAKKATGFGYASAEHFKESLNAFHASGFSRVGREHSNLGNFVDESVISSKFGRFLNAGTIFFRKGDEILRHTAWNSSYLEWRAKNPKAVFNDRAKQEVLQRADTLNVNMSSASDSTIQKNAAASIPLQFASYPMRLNEQLITSLLGVGKLSRREALSSIIAHSILYGVPAGAIGSTFSLWPVYEEWKKYLISRGAQIDADEAPLQKVFSDGVVSYLSEWAAGTEMDTSRYAPNGISIIRDLISGDPEKMQKALLGPSFGMMRDAMKNMYPVWVAAGDAFNGNYKLSAQDMIDATSFASSIKNTAKLVYALNYHKYVTKDQSVLDNVTDRAAWFSYFSGAMPRAISDSYLINELQKEEKAAKEVAMREARKNFNLAFQALADDKQDEATQYFKNASVHIIGGGLNFDDEKTLIGQVFGFEQEMAIKSMEKYSRNDLKRYNAFKKSLEKRSKKEEENN